MGTLEGSEAQVVSLPRGCATVPRRRHGPWADSGSDLLIAERGQGTTDGDGEQGLVPSMHPITSSSSANSLPEPVPVPGFPEKKSRPRAPKPGQGLQARAGEGEQIPAPTVRGLAPPNRAQGTGPRGARATVAGFLGPKRFMAGGCSSQAQAKHEGRRGSRSSRLPSSIPPLTTQADGNSPVTPDGRLPHSPFLSGGRFGPRRHHRSRPPTTPCPLLCRRTFR
jgi:hypothetical protein